jgi:uncharacterized protein (TIGR04222 family)
MNPFALHGPAFLTFYGVVGVLAIVLQYCWSRAREAGGRPSALKMTDPYLIAYLRDGGGEALRVAAVLLMERKLLTASGRMLVAEAGAGEKAGNPVEKAVLELFRTPQTAEALDTDGTAASAFAAYQEELVRNGLLAGPKTFSLRLIPLGVSVALVAGVGLVKLGIALSEGRHNVLYLIGMLIVFVLLSVGLYFKRGTRAGAAMLSDLETMFRELWARAETLPKESDGNEVAMLAAIFGLGALPEARFPAVYALQIEESTSNSSSLNNTSWSRSSSSGGSRLGGGSKLGCGG